MATRIEHDTFGPIPVCWRAAAVDGIRNRLLPSLAQLKDTLAAKTAAFMDIVKIGRTHLQDATRLTLATDSGGGSIGAKLRDGY